MSSFYKVSHHLEPNGTKFQVFDVFFFFWYTGELNMVGGFHPITKNWFHKKGPGLVFV